MTNPRLEQRRENSEPKCASCGWWQGAAAASGRCDRHGGITTLDLAVCSEHRDNDPVQTVMDPETDE